MMEFTKLPFKLFIVLVEGLILDSCPDKALMADQFSSNWNRGCIYETSLEKGSQVVIQV